MVTNADNNLDVMMPSLDHCINTTSDMTTLSNTLEVFDTYKHRDDKDSDEESFHLPLDDDETELKVPDITRNGIGNETEEDILNKFDSTSAAVDHIDSPLEESLLQDDEEEKNQGKEKKENEPDLVSSASSKSSIPEIVANGNHLEDEITEAQKNESKQESHQNFEGDDSCTEGHSKSINGTTLDHVEDEQVEDTTFDKKSDHENCDVHKSEKIDDFSETSKADAIKNNDVPKVDDVEENLASVVEEDGAIDASEDGSAQEANSVATCKVDDLLTEDIERDKEVNVKIKDSDASDEQTKKDSQSETKMDDGGSSSLEDNLSEDKSEEKSDDFSKHNEDSEDLFDISVIRDAEEDNAESAYNEAHPEETEEDDDRGEEKMEEECINEKTSNDEDDEEMDIDKHEDHLKSDDVDIEETNLKMECEATKDSGSDGESENSNKTDLVKINKEQKRTEPAKGGVVESGKDCRLDEVTGSLIGVDGQEINFEEHLNEEGTSDGDKNNEDSAKSSLKRPLSEETENGIAKKSRTELIADVEIKEVEKPKEKLPLRALLSLSDFMKTRKHNKRLTMHDLEEFCVQKICEAIVHKSELGDVHHQLKLQEQLIETMRKEIQQLTKQARDLEIVNKKLMNDLKQQTTTQKPLNPLKITRSVGLQVKFTPTFEANVKRRQLNTTMVNQKVQAQTAPNRGPRVLPNATNLPMNRQVSSPQKQQQQLPKPNTPLLSQALQNRRAGITDTINKTPTAIVRPKPADPKSGPPSASVIDLTDEDDKKDKNKNSSIKMVSPKSIAVPLRTTPMRVNATPQGIRLTTSQGKGSPITSVVTSSTPQVMYVVQSSPQNVLASTLGPKAVVVNFQSNGVLTSALNGSAVSVIPKQQNTIQLKTVAPGKNMQNNKIVKIANKHPAPLPAPPVVRVASDKCLKPIPPKPHLTIRKTDTGIILQWKMPYELDMYEVIASYQLYAYQETSAMPSTDMWRKVGDVKALALPMACTLTQFADKNKYYFAVRPVDIHKRIGMFSEPEEISL